MRASSRESGKKWGKGNTWSEAELAVLKANPDLTSRELTKLLPGRTGQAIGNMRLRHCPNPKTDLDQPVIKPPGDYLELLAAYLVDDFECLEIWARWNGYASYREISRDELGWVTLVCQAK